MSREDLFIDPLDYGCEQAIVVAIHEAGKNASEGEAIAEFECDKAMFELSMPQEGTIDQVFVKVGEVINSQRKIFEATFHAEIRNRPSASALLKELKERYSLIRHCESVGEAVEKLNSNVRFDLATTADAEQLAKIYIESSQAVGGRLEAELTDECVDWFIRAIESKNKQYMKCEIIDGQSIEIVTVVFSAAVQREGLPSPRTVFQLPSAPQLLSKYIDYLGGYPVVL